MLLPYTNIYISNYTAKHSSIVRISEDKLLKKREMNEQKEKIKKIKKKTSNQVTKYSDSS